jgi:hypothetical protein
MVGIVLRTLEDLERVLWVVNEVLVFRPFPLRIPHIQAEVLHHPAFEFSTSVNSVELNLLVGSSLPFDFQIKNLFAEVLYSVVVTKTLPLPPPIDIPSPEPPPLPLPLPSPRFRPPRSPSPPPNGGDGRLVTWNVKFFALPSGTTDHMYLKYLIAVSRDDGTSISRHYEERQSAPFVLSPEDVGAGIEISTVAVSVSVTKTSLSKTWNVQAFGTMSGTIYVNENVSVTAPPFNGQSEPNIPWIDTQIHTV